MGHHHHHHHQGKRLGLTIFLNIIITVLQLVVGLLSGSLSLVSDAMHNFSDVVSLVVSYIALKLSAKEYNEEQTFGFQRAEILAALLNGATLLGVAVLICHEAVTRLSQPEPIDSSWVILLAFLSILFNGFSVLLIKKDAESNLNLRSAYIHLFSDMLTSIAVLVGAVVVYYTEAYWVDSVLSILIAVYLVYVSWDLVIKTIHVLMHFAPKHIKLVDIEKSILNIDQVVSVHHAHLWQLTDSKIHFEAQVRFSSDLKLSQAGVVISEIRKILMESFEVSHVLIQPEFGFTNHTQLVGRVQCVENENS